MFSKSNYSRSHLLIMGIISLLVVASCIYAAVKDFRSWEMFYDNPASVDAIVIDNDKTHYFRDDTKYYPEVTYDYNGQEYTMRLYESSKFPAEIGSHKTLVVDGDNPNKLLSNPDSKLIIIGTIVTLTFAAVGIASLVQIRIDKK